MPQYLIQVNEPRIIQLSFDEANVLDATLSEEITAMKDGDEKEWRVLDKIQKRLRD